MAGVTFTVSETTPTNTYDVMNFSNYLNNLNVVRKNNGTVLTSTQPKNTVATAFSNGFVSAAFKAYSYHHHLILRPDDVWLAIVLTFAGYVDKHAEEMRKTFVDHDDKKNIEVHGSGNIKTIDWMAIVNAFAVEVGKQTKSSVREWLEPNFSTTTSKDRLIGQVALMSAMKHYFSYSCSITCGLPGVTLQGTLADWQNVRIRLDKLLEYAVTPLGKNSKDQPDLVTWHKMLAPVLDQFVLSYQGKVDKTFWNRICHYISGGSGPSYISGWINAFVPFNKAGNFCLVPSDEYPYGMIETSKVPSGAVEVEVKVNDNGRKYDTILYAGAMVNCYDRETNRMYPSFDFALVDVTDADKKAKSGPFEDEDEDN